VRAKQFRERVEFHEPELHPNAFASEQAAHDCQQQEGEGDDQQCLDRDQHATIGAGRAR
jgi:hypothetical protein